MSRTLNIVAFSVTGSSRCQPEGSSSGPSILPPRVYAASLIRPGDGTEPRGTYDNVAYNLEPQLCASLGYTSFTYVWFTRKVPRRKVTRSL